MSFINIIDLDNVEGNQAGILTLANKTSGFINTSSKDLLVCITANNDTFRCEELLIEYLGAHASSLSFRKILDPKQKLEIGCLRLYPGESIRITIASNIFAGDEIELTYYYKKENV